MKIFISQILNISLFLTFFNMSSQKDMISCLTETPENYIEIENQYKSTYDYHINTYYDKLNQKTSTAITNIPAKIHIVTDANGVTSICLLYTSPSPRDS